MKDQKVKSVFLHIGTPHLGAQMSLSSSKGAELIATVIGIRAKSKNGRVVIIPYSNVISMEMDVTEEAPAKK